MSEFFEGKEVLITGASQGIGKEIAKSFAQKGAHTFLLGKTVSKLEEVQDEILQIAPNKKCIVVDVDLHDEHAVNEAIKKIQSQSSQMSIIINNAGAYERLSLQDTTPDDIVMQTRLHVGSALQLIQAFLPDMYKNQFGRIINISSTAAFLGSESIPYAVSKSSLVGLTRSLVKRVAKSGITVNVVVPGPVDSPMTHNMPLARRLELERNLPIGRFANIEEIVDPVLFLCSKNASYINGACLHINGGLYFGE